MKKLFLLFILSISLMNVSGQPALTFHDNGPLPGDSSQTQEITWVDAGSAGADQVWDFSGIQYSGKSTFRGVSESVSPKSSSGNSKTMIFSEDGYDFTCNSREDGYEETGYVNLTKKMILDYSDPIVKMKYPFAYGEQFSDPFTGVARYDGSDRIDLAGDYTCKADAFGTLILRDRLIKNCLRVKVVKQSLQIGVCGSTQSKLEKFYWFAPGYRYPVFMLSVTENRYGAKEPVIIKNGWVNLNQSSQLAGTSVGSSSEIGGNAVIVYPNPFSEQVTYKYILQEQVPVTVELYDMSGKLVGMVEKRQVQDAGLHAGTINSGSFSLKPGVYSLRFTLDHEVIVTKIVKI
jgi:hypothetical protein